MLAYSPGSAQGPRHRGSLVRPPLPLGFDQENHPIRSSPQNTSPSILGIIKMLKWIHLVEDLANML